MIKEGCRALSASNWEDELEFLQLRHIDLQFFSPLFEA